MRYSLGLVTLLVVLSNVCAYAEKKSVTFTTKWGNPEVAVVTPSVFSKDHILAQWERRDRVVSSDTEWDGTEAVYFEQTDEVAGSGVVSGYAVLTFKDGDKAFFRIDGAYTGAYKESGAWEGTAEGMYRFLGGTGKYTNIRGTMAGHCKGVDDLSPGKAAEGASGCTMTGEVEF